MKTRILFVVAAVLVGGLMTGCSHLRTYHGPLAQEQAAPAKAESS